MVDNIQNRDRDVRDRSETVGVEDVYPVRSRISWGAILAGAVIAIATYLLLTMLGSAIGLSVEPSADDDVLGWGAIIWAVVASLLAMFIGGWITSLCTAGESKAEAAIYGFVTWGVTLGLLLWFIAVGIGAGVNTMMGLAETAASADANWAAAARRAGIDPQTIDQWQKSLQNAPAQANQAVQDPANQEAARETAAAGSWIALAGMLLSLGAAIAGAVFGAGPAFHLGVAVSTKTTVGAARRTGRYTAAN